MGNPNQHASDPLPVLLAGGQAGRGNRHLLLAPRTPVGNLWVAVANRFSDSRTAFGDSNGLVEVF
jgi:hypothetical protein